MNGEAAFAVPKDRQNITVRLSQGAPLVGEIFMESIAEGLSIHQKITSFIENSTAFFPIKLAPGGSTEFINKNKVQVFEVSMPEDPETDYFAHLLMQTIPVTVFLNDGSTVSGELLAEVPQEKARLSDCLNMTEKFLVVKSGERMCYVNKSAVQKVVHREKL